MSGRRAVTGFETGRACWVIEVVRLVAVVAFVFGVSASHAIGSEPRWPAGTYKYITVDQAVGDVLVEFGRNIGVPVKVSNKVKGRLSAVMPLGTAREFLEAVCNRYGLIWHFDGSVLNVATEEEINTELLMLDVDAAARASERLERWGVADSRFPIKISKSDNVVSISGPPSYVELVKKTLGLPVQPTKKLLAI